MIIALSAVTLTVILGYLYGVLRYNQSYRSTDRQQVPPLYPNVIPFFGAVVPFLWNAPAFLKRVTSFAGGLSSVRIALWPGMNVYIFQERDTIKAIWKSSNLMSALYTRVWAHKMVFGTPDEWISLYRSDNSGPFAKPYRGSTVPRENRIHHLLHVGMEAALTGSGFQPTLERFRAAFVIHLEQLNVPRDAGIQQPDFRRFVHNTVGRAFIQAIFGPNLLEVNPTFIDDLFDFNCALPRFARGTPEIFMPGAYAGRRRLHNHFKRWYAFARENFTETCIYDDGDGDPFWGSAWLRQRQKAWVHVIDDGLMASTDLGLALGSIGNMVLCAIMTLVHVYSDKELLARIRNEVEPLIDTKMLKDMDLKQLSTLPLISSVYAETLRLYIKSYIVIHSPFETMKMGRWCLPRGEIGVINSDLSHMDAELWNTKGGLYPVQSFWAERFVKDPSDPSSGPINPALWSSSQDAMSPQPTGKPYFSTDGLEGSWFPYSGGTSMCPGRHLAKYAILIACACFTKLFEIEIREDAIKFDTSRYGLGAQNPRDAVPFSIQRRS